MFDTFLLHVKYNAKNFWFQDYVVSCISSYDKILCLVLLFGQTTCLPKKEIDVDQESQASAKNARYYFSADVNDEVTDVKSHRHELRFGTEVAGSFSYSDGFVVREVIYTADKGGYRVISDRMENLSQKADNSSINATSPIHVTETESSELPLLRKLHLHSKKTKAWLAYNYMMCDKWNFQFIKILP